MFSSNPIYALYKTHQIIPLLGMNRRNKVVVCSGSRGGWPLLAVLELQAPIPHPYSQIEKTKMTDHKAKAVANEVAKLVSTFSKPA